MIEEFKTDLSSLTPERVFRKHILLSNSQVLTDDQYFQLKESISEKYSVNFTDVVMVGSAKLGFSIKPGRRWGEFGDDSDIDIAIVSRSLYEKYWKLLYQYSSNGGYWPRLGEFQKFFFRGWIRPDKLPPGHLFKEANEWWEYFNAITQAGEFGAYPIKAGLYHSWNFLESFQCLCIKQCQQEIEVP